MELFCLARPVLSGPTSLRAPLVVVLVSGLPLETWGSERWEVSLLIRKETGWVEGP